MSIYIQSECGDCEQQLDCCINTINVEDGTTTIITNQTKFNCYRFLNSYGPCEQSVGVTFTNNTGASLNINVTGGVDDDVMFNGVVYEDGEYCFFRSDCVWFETPCTYVNGAHSFDYNQSLASGSSIIIKGIDNGFGGGIDCTISFS